MFRLQHHIRVKTNRERVTARRDFLKAVGAASLTGGAMSWTDRMSLAADDLRSRGQACILLWMQGGPSQFETFSPKPNHANGGETKAIKTTVPGIEIADNFPSMAKVMDDVTVVRSMTSKEGSHPRASFFMHHGRLQAQIFKRLDAAFVYNQFRATRDQCFNLGNVPRNRRALMDIPHHPPAR